MSSLLIQTTSIVKIYVVIDNIDREFITEKKLKILFHLFDKL